MLWVWFCFFSVVSGPESGTKAEAPQLQPCLLLGEREGSNKSGAILGWTAQLPPGVECCHPAAAHTDALCWLLEALQCCLSHSCPRDKAGVLLTEQEVCESA